MPELPEVETVRAGLVPSMQGHVITRAEVNRPDLRWPFPDDMAQRLTGATVTALRRRSKYILADLSTGETLIIHLGMSGRMTVSGDPLGQFHNDHPAPAKHDHVVFHMGNGARVTFNDPRRFGAMDLAKTDALNDHWLIKPIGPEPLGNGFNEAYLVEAFAAKNTPVKTALLDRGLGQYLCLRSPVSRPHRPDAKGERPVQETSRVACAYRARCPERSDRSWWLIAQRLPPSRWRTWLFSKGVSGLRPRGPPLPNPRMHRINHPYRAVGTINFLLPQMSKIACPCATLW
jgi:hypothetical protein